MCSLPFLGQLERCSGRMTRTCNSSHPKIKIKTVRVEILKSISSITAPCYFHYAALPTTVMLVAVEMGRPVV